VAVIRILKVNFSAKPNNALTHHSRKVIGGMLNLLEDTFKQKKLSQTQISRSGSKRTISEACCGILKVCSVVDIFAANTIFAWSQQTPTLLLPYSS